MLLQNIVYVLIGLSNETPASVIVFASPLLDIARLNISKVNEFTLWAFDFTETDPMSTKLS